MLGALELQDTVARDDEQHLLPIVPPLGGLTGSETDHALLEAFAAPRRIDRRADLGCIARDAHAVDVLLRNDEPLDNRHATILTTARGGVNDKTVDSQFACSRGGSAPSSVVDSAGSKAGLPWCRTRRTRCAACRPPAASALYWVSTVYG